MNHIAASVARLAAVFVIAGVLEGLPNAFAQPPLDTDDQRPRSLFDFDFQDPQALQRANAHAVWIVRDSLVQTALARRCAKLDAEELAGLVKIEKSIGTILIEARASDPILRQGVIVLRIISTGANAPPVIYAAKATSVSTRRPIVGGLEGGTKLLKAASKAVGHAIKQQLSSRARIAFTKELEQREQWRIVATSEYLLTAIGRLQYLSPQDTELLRDRLTHWSSKQHFPVSLLTRSALLPHLPREVFNGLEASDVYANLEPMMAKTMNGMEEDVLWFRHASAVLHLDAEFPKSQDSGDAK
ncbi:MAG TPA: hypothetical protein DDW52_24250 [Planctomycetaceae bacterium]|nr:hypothetical protein [Planctomycetaceae bacterium]